MYKKLLSISVLLCASMLNAGQINVAVAANVSYAMPLLKAEFNKLHPDVEVKENLTSSGKLTAQIRNGAPFAIFMSANMKYPEALAKEGLSATKPVVYARGSLAYLTSKKIDLSKGMELLKDKDIQKIAIANPKTAPYGKASMEAFNNAKVYENIKDKLVFAESISQSVAYALSATDIGFVAKSALYDEKMKDYKKGTHWEDVDPKLYTPIDQGIILLKKYETNKDAKAFYDFILSDKARAIFKDFGYILP